MSPPPSPPDDPAPAIAVAIVEDNADLREDLLFALARQGYATWGCRDGAELDAALAAGRRWDVLVLDLGLPGEDGLSIARRLRRLHPGLGIVMLTARGAVADRIVGLDAGADIYLAKPVDLRELGAAVAAVARRVRQVDDSRSHGATWLIDRAGMKLRGPEGQAIDLSFSELQVLLAIAASPDRAASRDTLIRALGRDPSSYDEHTLEVMVSRLRQKLGRNAPLRAVRNRGYAFTSPIEVSAPSQ